MRHSLAVFLLLTLAACSSSHVDPKAQDLANKVPAEELYAQAQTDMEDGNLEKAIKSLETLQSRYPYGRYAQQAQMEIAYAYYKHEEPEAALTAVDRFIKQYPNSQNLDYVLYLKGLINFIDNTGFLQRLSQQDPAERDPQSAKDSFDAFRELVTRFPDSIYAPDARIRMQYLTNLLARAEIQVASYYLRRGAYVAAVARANNVLKEFPETPQTRDALQIMIQAYDAMGQKDLRDDAQRVLDQNMAKDGIKPGTQKYVIGEKPWWRFW
ncbi:MAG TPA: outer membrane protein assembly factor BamD [Gallionellaceae bacterium]|nr:outer membrane protein assembly factor BamD [Gallionellaceae bacterium]